MIYKIRTTVRDLMHKQRVVEVKADRSNPLKPVFEWKREDVGWFVQFDGSYEALFMGADKPEDLAPGTEVEILIKAIK